MKYFSKKSFTMRQVVGLLTIVFLGITVIAYAAVTVPNTFSSGTTISSSQVNANFTTLGNAISGTAENLRIIRGSIGTSGSIVYGTGFTVTNSSTGRYTITYATPFSGGATATANVWTFDGYARVAAAGTTFTTIDLFDSTGALTNGGFHFIAMGVQ